MAVDDGDVPQPAGQPSPSTTGPEPSQAVGRDSETGRDPEANSEQSLDTLLDAVVETAPAQVVDLDWRVPLVALAAVAFLISVVTLLTATPAATRLLVLAVLLSLAIDPVVVRVQRLTKLRRGHVVALLCGTGLAVAVLGVLFFGPGTVDQARSFQDDLPRVLDQLTSIPVIGPILDENDVPHQIQQWLSKLPKQLSGQAHLLSNAAEVVTTGLLEAVAMTLVMVALLIDGPMLVARVQMLVPRDRQERARRFGRIIYDVVGRYFAGSLVLAGLQGLAVLVTGLVLGVPLSPLLAVWAALWNLVPQIGGAVGGITFVAVAFTVSPTAGVLAGAVFMVYLTFANNVLLPVIIGRSVDISPFTTMVAAISGFAVAGIVGAMLAAPVFGAGKAMYFEIRPHMRPKREQLENRADKAAPPPPGRLRRALSRVGRRT
ncbi:MAG: AI-2E family transporter [Acidimicrobiales bacterium]|nr:AI-2E family transporter [Acidimicrobiales bacterium]